MSQAKSRGVTLRSPAVRDIARRLATLGRRRLEKGSALNVRRHEDVRRTLTEAGETLGWSEFVALSSDPVSDVAKEVKKMVRSGVRSLERSVADELADKEAEANRLETLVETVREMADDPSAEYPAEVTYSRTATNHTDGYVTKTETLSINDSEEARKAAAKIERSLPRWGRLRELMLTDLRSRQESLAMVRGNLSELIDAWRLVLGEVLVTMH